MHEVFAIIIHKIIHSDKQKNQSKNDQLIWFWKMSNLVLMMIFEFVLTCFWDMWCHKFRTHVKIDFWNLSFTIQSQFHHKDHTNCTNCQARSDHMWWYSHNAAILVEMKKTKHAEYKNDKRKIIKYESNSDNNNEKNKNEKQKI